MTESGPRTGVALITGAADRIGAGLAEYLHGCGMEVIIHCRSQRDKAEQLARTLNSRRADSATVIAADLSDAAQVAQLVQNSKACFGPVSLLINNASVFNADPSPEQALACWHDTLDTNLRAPWLLAMACADDLRQRRGNIINLIDIYADHPLPGHAIYNTSKAGLQMLTRSLARELAPEVRVNGIAPGAILWPEQAPSPDRQQALLDRIPLGRLGSTRAIIEAADFLLRCDYITGQVIKIDGGRSLAI
jgi:pteridine reductase